MDLLSGFATFFRNGGPFMFVILAIGVVALAIILERFWTIGRAGSIDSRKLLKDLEGRISQGDLVGALSLSKQVTGPVAHVASSVLSSDMRNDDRIYNAAESAATIVLPPLSRRLALLGVLANTATLLGLLGTIFGLTTAFSAVGAADPAQRSAFLAAGIPEEVFRNVVLDHEATEALISGRHVDFVNFTGSVAGGQAMERAAAGNLKRTWVNDGKARDWYDPDCRPFLAAATEVKNIWVPYGE